MLTFGASRCSLEVHRGHDERTDGRRGQVDELFAVAGPASRRWRCARGPTWRRTRCRSRRTRAWPSGRRPRRRWSRHPSALLGRARPRRVDTDHRPHLEVLEEMRRTLIIRSVPMLPEPMMATFVGPVTGADRSWWRGRIRGGDRRAPVRTVAAGVRTSHCGNWNWSRWPWGQRGTSWRRLPLSPRQTSAQSRRRSQSSRNSAFNEMDLVSTGAGMACTPPDDPGLQMSSGTMNPNAPCPRSTERPTASRK